jgi:hypothetical protein
MDWLNFLLSFIYNGFLTRISRQRNTRPAASKVPAFGMANLTAPAVIALIRTNVCVR